MNNSAAVYDVLCNEEAWHWDTYDGHKLIFHRDGTGEITSWAELNMWIFAIFEWKVHDPATVEYNAPVSPAGAQRSVIPNLFSRSRQAPPELRAAIEFTLTKRRPLRDGKVFDPQHLINEDVLLDAAFEPRVLNITVERGRFKAPWNRPSKSFFKSRLSFDVSPYPAKEAWRPRQHAMVNSIGQPKMAQFCAQELAREDGGCVVM